MITQRVDIKTHDGVCDCFIAYPDDNGRYPAVLFFMDAFGPSRLSLRNGKNDRFSGLLRSFAKHVLSPPQGPYR